jgi:3-dehydroquinate synthase
MPEFRIQEQCFTAEISPSEGRRFTVRSVPRAYEVRVTRSEDPSATVEHAIAGAQQPLILADRAVWKRWMSGRPALQRVPRLEFEAVENNKTIAKVLDVVEFLLAANATKQSMLFVVGGGIVQDVAAFACAMYKRGLPWTFIPTTLLAQGDSGIGAKSSLNHGATKNLLALFSAPRAVGIDTGFLASLPKKDLLSGMGEILRLHVTGGIAFLEAFATKMFHSAEPDYESLLVSALSVKRAVIEHDEFELDLRRALNYGHSLGHAFEALSDYRIPHGTAVVLGMLAENELVFRRGALSVQDRDAIMDAARPIVPMEMVDELKRLQPDRLLALLQHDKKAVGGTLKLAAPCQLGHIRFVDVPLEPRQAAVLWECVSTVANVL